MHARLSLPQTTSDTPRKRVYNAEKRAVDIAFSCFILIFFWWLFLLIAAVIKLDNPNGPVLFSQIRVGKNGTPFRMWKFRTMVPGAEEMLPALLTHNEKDGPAFKIKGDPRITPIGSFLRKTSLDELPQFFNVLAGDMSLVGPRPPLPAEVDKYTSFEWQRLSIKPGLTCIWQIQPNRDELSFNEWMQLDMLYLEQQNSRLDMEIIWHTVRAVLRAQGR